MRFTGSFFTKPVLFSDSSHSMKKKEMLSNQSAFPVICASKNSRCNPSQPPDSALQRPELCSLRKRKTAITTFKDISNALPGSKHGQFAAQRTPGTFVTRCQ